MEITHLSALPLLGIPPTQSLPHLLLGRTRTGKWESLRSEMSGLQEKGKEGPGLAARSVPGSDGCDQSQAAPLQASPHGGRWPEEQVSTPYPAWAVLGWGAVQPHNFKHGPPLT